MTSLHILRIGFSVAIGLLVAVTTARVVRARCPIGPPCIIGVCVGALSAIGLMGIGKGMFAVILLPYEALALALLAVLVQGRLVRFLAHRKVSHYQTTRSRITGSGPGHEVARHGCSQESGKQEKRDECNRE